MSFSLSISYNNIGDNMRISKLQKNLMKVCKLFQIGQLEAYEKQLSHQNNVYKVTTDKGIYIIKEFTKDAISNYYYLNKRKKQIEIAEKLNRNKINCLIPKSLHKRHFLFVNQNYYLVYDYSKSKVINQEDFTNDHLKALAVTLSSIHKLEMKIDIPCVYKKITINLNKLLREGKKHPEFHNYLKENKDKLQEFIDRSNKDIKVMKKNLCISHNDYKALNILWEGLTPTLIDFDASGLSNPSCCMAESALNFSITKDGYDFDKYKTYIKSYIKHYGPILEHYRDVLYASMNGKLQWYNYIISKKNFNDILGMTKDLIYYYDNIEKLYSIYKSVR